MSIEPNVLILDTVCKFLGVAGGRKKGALIIRTGKEEGLVTAPGRRDDLMTCQPSLFVLVCVMTPALVGLCLAILG